MQNILIRADSSFDIGTGHIMRDLVLATQYTDATITFATRELNGNINDKITNAGYGVYILKSDDVNELISLIHTMKIDMLIVDHYGIGLEDEEKIKKEATVTLMVLDDLYNKHHCDVLLNHNVYAESPKYYDLVPLDCEVRCGIQYTLLRDEFLRKSTTVRGGIDKRLKLFLAMGGADSKSMNLSILNIIYALDIEIHIVSTHANKHLAKLEVFVKKHENMHLHIDAKNIVDIIDICDVALVTPSVMVNEIIFLGIPFISIMVTDNQFYMYEFLKERGFPTINKTEIVSLPEMIKAYYEKNYFQMQVNKIEKILQLRIN